MFSGMGSAFFNNPADAAMPYYQQAQSQLPQYYMPWMQGGMNAMNQLSPLLSQMTQNPGGMVNQIGSNYQQSPGFQFALNQALKASNQSANAGGMAGSPMTQQQNMGIATGMANQDYYNYLNNAENMFGQGVGGLQNMMGMGANASMGLGQNLASLLESQGNMAYAGQANQNQMGGGIFGDLAGLGSAYFLGGGKI